MENLQLPTACPNYQHSHLGLSLVVSPAAHTALQCTGGSIPLPSASAAPSFAERPNWDSIPKDRNSKLEKAQQSKCLPPAAQGGKAKHKSRIRAAIEANGSLLLLTFLRGALEISTCAAFLPRGPAAWVAQKASQLLHNI